MSTWKIENGVLPSGSFLVPSDPSPRKSIVPPRLLVPCDPLAAFYLLCCDAACSLSLLYCSSPGERLDGHRDQHTRLCLRKQRCQVLRRNDFVLCCHDIQCFYAFSFSRKTLRQVAVTPSKIEQLHHGIPVMVAGLWCVNDLIALPVLAFQLSKLLSDLFGLHFHD